MWMWARGGGGALGFTQLVCVAVTELGSYTINIYSYYLVHVFVLDLASS
eukprot:COSAG05_NODE_10805_length_545_cov_1.381166_1_plen_49_part_00